MQRRVAIKGNRLLREIRHAEVEISYVFDRMKLRNCPEHKKEVDKALGRGWDCLSRGVPGIWTWDLGK